jgi:CheY-like chemotaxis protein
MVEPDKKAKLVLVIDDDDGVRELLTFLVKKEGYRVECAVDGEEGYQKAERLKPDLILLDLMMPRYGGFEVLRQLQSGGLSRIPIVVVTGRYTDRSTSEMIRQESNVVDFLEKPLKPNVLTSTLERLLKPHSSEAA